MQKNIEKFIFFLGVDVGKDQLSVCLRRQGEMLARDQFSNNASGLDQLLHWLNALGAHAGQCLICLEHTGLYDHKLCLVGYGAGYQLWKVSARRLAHIQLSPDRLKSDAADSQKIAAFCERFADQAQLFVPDSEEIRQLKQLTRVRRQLVDHRQRLLNQQHAHLQDPMHMSSLAQIYTDTIEQLSAKIKQVEQQIDTLFQQKPPLKQINKILCSIPGIGPATARQLIIVTQAFTRLNNHKKLAAMAGTAPFENTSGANTKWKKRRISQQANKELKKLLTTAVMATIKPGAYFHQYYLILLNKPGRLPLQAINIIRNKLLKLAITLVGSKQLFDRKLFIHNAKAWNTDLILS